MRRSDLRFLFKRNSWIWLIYCQCTSNSNSRLTTARSPNMQLYRGAQGSQRPIKHSKITSQRQYRVKEGDGFQELRDVIRSVTGEAPQTRRETLKKGVVDWF